jgi:hypothetical protein
MMYHPECGEQPAPRLFATSHNYGSAYSLTWPASRDEEARSMLRTLRIRALKQSPIRAEKLGDWSPLRQFNEDGFACLVSYHAHSKLLEADLCAYKVLLD